MRNKTLLILAAIAMQQACITANAQTPVVTVKGAINMALINNPSLQADSLNISIQNEKNKQLQGSYKPQVTYSSNVEYNPAIGSQMLPGHIVGQPDKELVAVQAGTKYNYRSGFEVTQTLFRKDLLVQIKAAPLQTAIAVTKFKISKEELVYQVAALFYSLQTNAEMIRTTGSDYLNMREVLRIAKGQYENGILKRIDYETLEINVANLESQLNQLQTQYNDQLAYFNYLLGIPASAQTIISDSIPENVLPVKSGGSVLQREDVHLSSQMIQAKEVELLSIRAEKAPQINSYFRYNYHSNFNDPGKALTSEYLYNTSTIGLSVSVSIFDGNRRRSRISMTKAQIEQLKITADHQIKQAEMELYSAQGTLINNLKEYRITKQNLDLAIRVFNTRKALYTEGVTTLVELLDAERELSKARSQHMQALINVQTGRLDVHKANGTLLTEYIKSI